VEGAAYRPLTGLATRLMASCADVGPRLALAADPQALSGAACHALLAQAGGWEPLAQFLRRLVAERRPTLVYGDYDADGVTSTFLMHRWLKARDVPGNYYLPSRFKYGYGLAPAVVEQAAQQGYSALLVLDCGTANAAEIARARQLGLAVAVIDHHQLKDELPAAPLLNPELDPALPPMCTAGLVYHVLAALDAALPPAAACGDEVELAGLATLADVVPLVPRNWLLAQQALARLPGTGNAGLLQLIKTSGLHGLDSITATQAGFQLAPRLNAPGRIRHPRQAYELLAAASAAEAATAGAEVERANEERKRQTDRVAQEALRQAAQAPAGTPLALYSAEWSLGVLGIAAARVAEQLGVPAVVFTDAPGDAQLLSGSARSQGGVDLVQALAACGDCVLSFGGHAQAAGVKLRRDSLAEFAAAWAAAALPASIAPEEAAAAPAALATAQLYELTAQLEDDIWRLAPFGAGYPPPQCRLEGLRIVRASYMGRDRLHANIVVGDGEREVRLAGFNMSHLVGRLRAGDPVAADVALEPDNWNNARTIMLRLLGIHRHAAQGSRA
jgi:single-stranded-DNA-specific exonuclease